MQVFNSTPPSQSVPPSSRKDKASGSAAKAFQARVDHSGNIRLIQSWEGEYLRVGDHDRGRETSTYSDDRRSERTDWPHGASLSRRKSRNRSSISTKPSRRDCQDDDWSQQEDWDGHQSHRTVVVDEEDWDNEINRSQTLWEDCQRVFVAERDHPRQSDDHVVGPDPYSAPPPQQPGSYPWGEKLTSKRVNYEDLKDSLVTTSEDLLIRGQIDAAIRTGNALAEDDCPLPPPPREGDPGYEDNLRQRAAKDLAYQEEQAKKHIEWDQLSYDFKTVKRGFTPGEPHPENDALHWLLWNDGKTKAYPQWALELQSICLCDYCELARKMVLSWQWPAAVNKLGILDIPCPPPLHHLKLWMFKIDDLSNWNG